MYNTDQVWNENTADQIHLESFQDAPGEERTFAPNEIIIREGDTANSMFFLLEGKAQVIINHRTADERLVSTLHPGDMFGEMALFLDEPRSATIIALGDTTAFEIHRDTVEAFISRNPANACAIVAILCRRLKNVLATLAE